MYSNLCKLATFFQVGVQSRNVKICIAWKNIVKTTGKYSLQQRISQSGFKQGIKHQYIDLKHQLLERELSGNELEEVVGEM